MKVSTGREAASAAPYSLHQRVPMRNGFPTFSAGEIARRHTHMREAMEAGGIALLVAYGAGRFNPDMLYLSNWPGGREGYVLLPRDGEPALLVQLFNHFPLARCLSLIPDTSWAGPDSIARLAERIGEAGAGAERIGLVGPWSFGAGDRLAALLPHAQLVDFTQRYRALRSVRSEEELTFFRAAAELTDRAMEAIEAELRPGMREYEVAAVVEDACRRSGGYGVLHYMSSTPMDEPAAFVPHQYQSDRVIQEGDVLITEISGGFWCHASQIHRTYTVGREPNSLYRELEAVAEEALESILAVLRDGATVEDVLDAAELIERRGFTIFDDLLHGADQYPPILRTRETDHGPNVRTNVALRRAREVSEHVSHPAGFRFRENLIVTVQPNVTTRDRRAGLQYGETVRIAADGVERLHGYRGGIITVGV